MAGTAIALSSPGGKALTSGGSKPTLEKAWLELHEAKPAGSGGGALGSQRGRITFQFNPKELTIQKSAKWERKPARGSKAAGPPEFNGAEPCKLTMELFFDASGKLDNSVVESVEQLFACCVPTEESRAKKKASPPLVVFHWGKVRGFSGFVTSVSAKYTLFSPDGTPVRAVCNVSMEEMPGDPSGQNPTSGALATRTIHTLVEGDTLASVAYKEYGDPGMWRRLAEFNGIDDPMQLRYGTSLLVPAPEELLAPAG
jgi:hypothetical protein